MIAIDVAASEWKGSKIGEYILPKSGKQLIQIQHLVNIYLDK